MSPSTKDNKQPSIFEVLDQLNREIPLAVKVAGMLLATVVAFSSGFYHKFDYAPHSVVTRGLPPLLINLPAPGKTQYAHSGVDTGFTFFSTKNKLRLGQPDDIHFHVDKSCTASIDGYIAMDLGEVDFETAKIPWSEIEKAKLWENRSHQCIPGHVYIIHVEQTIVTNDFWVKMKIQKIHPKNLIDICWQRLTAIPTFLNSPAAKFLGTFQSGYFHFRELRSDGKETQAIISRLPANGRGIHYIYRVDNNVYEGTSDEYWWYPPIGSNVKAFYLPSAPATSAIVGSDGKFH